MSRWEDQMRLGCFGWKAELTSGNATRPELPGVAMDEEMASDLFEGFLRRTELECNEPLRFANRPTHFSAGWVFNYQSRAYLETGNFSTMLVGQGPVLICDDGRVIAGGSLDHDAEELFKHGPLAHIAATRNFEIMQARGRRKVRGSKT